MLYVLLIFRDYVEFCNSSVDGFTQHVSYFLLHHWLIPMFQILVFKSNILVLLWWWWWWSDARRSVVSRYSIWVLSPSRLLIIKATIKSTSSVNIIMLRFTVRGSSSGHPADYLADTRRTFGVTWQELGCGGTGVAPAEAKCSGPLVGETSAYSQ